MKLIDILVKRGKWPRDAYQAAQDDNGDVCFYTEGVIERAEVHFEWKIPTFSHARLLAASRFNSELSDDRKTSIVTREQYEAAISKPEIGVKHDNGKFRFSLLPWNAVKEVIDVLEFGAKKYAPDNWKRVDDHRDRYFNATIRHVTAWYAGEKNDPETGLNHLAHAVCCLLFLIWFDKNEQN